MSFKQVMNIFALTAICKQLFFFFFYYKSSFGLLLKVNLYFQSKLVLFPLILNTFVRVPFPYFV